MPRRRLYPSRALFALTLSLALGPRLFAQSEITLGHYHELLPYFNAGATAMESNFRLVAVHTRQWEGISDAPKSFVVSGEMPLKVLGGRHGAGVLMSNETFGLWVDTELSARYALGFGLAGGHLRLGLGLHLLNTRLEGSRISIPQGIEGAGQTDSALPTSDISGRGLDASIGAFYSNRKLWAGISVGQLLASDIVVGDRFRRMRTRGYTFVGGYNYQRGKSLFSWHPSLLAQIDEVGMYRLDGRLGVWYRERFYLSGIYRHNASVGVGLGIRLGKAYLGYQYELPTNALRAASWGNHEVLLSYSLPINLEGKRLTKYKSIRLL